MTLERSPHPKNWVHSYAEQHRDRIAADPQFARWLQEEYIPIFGGWQY